MSQGLSERVARSAMSTGRNQRPWHCERNRQGRSTTTGQRSKRS